MDVQFKIGTCVVHIVSFATDLHQLSWYKLFILIDISLKFRKKEIVEKNLCKFKFKDVIHHWQSLHLRKFIKSLFE